MTKVDFAIVGVPKSATTFLHRVLRSHLHVMMEESENPLFNSDQWEARLVPLLTQAKAGGRTLCGIKRPDMIFHAASAERMKAHNPDVKAIAVLRHPVERAAAHYFHHVKSSFLPLVDFATGIRALLSGEMQRDWPRGHEVLDFSVYGAAMKAYVDVLGQDRVQFFTHDEVKEDALDVVRRTCAFLGLGSEGDIKLPENKPQKVMYSLERLRFLRHANEALMELDTFCRARSFSRRPQSEHEEAWAYMVKQFDEKVMAAKFPNEPPRLDTATWELLYGHFQQDIAQVEAVLGRALPAWHQNPWP